MKAVSGEEELVRKGGVKKKIKPNPGDTSVTLGW